MFLLMSVGHPCVCQYISMSVRCPYICCVPGVFWASFPTGVLTYSFYRYSHLQPQELIEWVFFLCHVFLIMSPGAATTTMPLVTVLCSRASPMTMTVTMASTSVGLAVLGQHDVLLPHSKGFCWPYHCAAAETTSVPDTFLGMCQLCHVSFSGEFFLSGLNLPLIHYVVCCCLLWCLVSFSFPCGHQ